jgi:hypothetical protein
MVAARVLRDQLRLFACAALAKTTPALLPSGTQTKHTAERYRALIPCTPVFTIFEKKYQ